MTREEAIQILSTRDRYGVPCGYTSGYQEALDMAIEALTLEPKTGKWILTDFPDEQTYKCSSCNEHWVFLEGTPYDNGAYFCPKCGADMRGVRCKDCMNWEEYEGDEGYGHCELFIRPMKDDNFCGHGERKTDPQMITIVKDHGRKQALEMIDLYHELKIELRERSGE